MNEVIQTIQHHRSIRKYEDRSLSDEQIRTIVESAQAAATSSYLQAYSIIGVKDMGKKKKLAELAGNQSYVETNGHFFIFCADLHRHEVLGNMEGVDLSSFLGSTENYMVATIDAALAAQNAALAAESMGLGICYIGGIRNNLEEVAKLLNIPSRVVPLFGLTVGYPLHEGSVKPRLPFEEIYHEDGYQDNLEKTKESLTKYNQVIKDYYIKRTGGKRSDTWTSQMVQMLSSKSREYMKGYVQGQGLDLK
ncbi:oxygen-insensitive NADPH nitroreductase [Ectobacillus sp. sgz5001026]|uniref:oxygen-insensitive NADPH nitroreductase n=1 Tax=Ectobacillus sp. sgz5001026 TaxID=3242473 RepID=UPI0036D43A4D